MINQDLLTADKKRIFFLEKTIKDFKAYDAKRKVYIKALESEIQELKEELTDIKTDSKDAKLKEWKAKYKQRVEDINDLNSKLMLAKQESSLLQEVLDCDKFELIKRNIELIKNLDKAREEIKKLRSVNTVVQNANKDLVCKLFKEEDALVILDIIQNKIINKLS